MKFTSPTRRRGVTLLEVLVVLAISGILITLSIVVIQRAQEAANRVECLNNLQQLALQTHQYHNDKRKLPPYASGMQGEIFGGWYVHLLPYAGYYDLYQRIQQQSDFTSPNGVRIISPANAIAGAATFPGLLCWSDPSPGSTIGKTNYLANWYAFGDGALGAYAPSMPLVSITDGLSNTVLFAEAYMYCDQLQRVALVSVHHHNFGITQHNKPSDDPANAPNDYTMFQHRPEKCDNQRTQTPHDYMHVALADGSVRSISPNIAPTMWKQALKPRDGGVVTWE